MNINTEMLNEVIQKRRSVFQQQYSGEVSNRSDYQANAA